MNAIVCYVYKHVIHCECYYVLCLCSCSINTGSKDKMNLTINSLRVMTTPECETFPCAVKMGTNVTIVISLENVGMSPS